MATALITITYGSGPHIMALTALGELYGWGHNGYGQLGLGTTAAYHSSPSLAILPSKCKVAKVACGSFHSVALTENREVGERVNVMWGGGADQIEVPVGIVRVVLKEMVSR